GDFMYTVTVSDHMMIAHSFCGEAFGPSQRLHGATYTVEVAFSAENLDANGIVVDIGRASGVLRGLLDDLDRQNLDDMAQFAGQNTTTEVLARHIADQLAEALQSGSLGAAGGRVSALTATLRESPVAWASYQRTL